MDGGVADTAPKGFGRLRGCGGVCRGFGRRARDRVCVRLFVVVGNLKNQSVSVLSLLSLCDPCARVSRVSRGRVCSSSPQEWFFSVGVNEGSDLT